MTRLQRHVFSRFWKTSPLASPRKVTDAALVEKVSSCSPIFGQRICLAKVFLRERNKNILSGGSMNNTRVMCKTALNTTQFEGTTQGGDVKWFQFRI